MDTDKIRVVFCGQKNLYLTRKAYGNARRNLEAELVKLLDSNFDKDITFYFSGDGGLDAMARDLLYGLKDIYNFKIILVSEIPLERRAKIESSYKVIFPFTQLLKGGSPSRRRNEWLVDNADVLYSYSPLKLVYDKYMLEYATNRKKIMDKPEIIFVTST